MGEVFSGLCIGGPLDGRRVDHYAPRYQVLLKEPAPVSLKSSITLTADKIDAKVFTYAHEKCVDAHFWVPEAIRRGGMFEHKFYECSLEFIFKRLMANYRPEGY